MVRVERHQSGKAVLHTSATIQRASGTAAGSARAAKELEVARVRTVDEVPIRTAAHEIEEDAVAPSGSRPGSCHKDLDLVAV